MNAPLAALMAAFLLAPTGALARSAPTLGKIGADARIRSVDYDPSRVVRVVGAFRTATQIVFAPGETLTHVALGDTSAWDVAALDNVLFLKPKVRRAPTNLIVTTARSAVEGGEATRQYAFELVTRPDPRRRGAADFQLRFRYPEDERAQALATLSAAEVAIRRAMVRFRLERGALEGLRNLAYAVQGPADLAPSEISDNGRFTVLRFPAAQPIPALYTVAPDGSESLAPLDVRGEFVVLHEVARQIRLRRGREVACLWNKAFAPYSASTGAHTAASDVERTETGAGPR